MRAVRKAAAITAPRLYKLYVTPFSFCSHTVVVKIEGIPPYPFVTFARAADTEVCPSLARQPAASTTVLLLTHITVHMAFIVRSFIAEECSLH
jgi:hypothetical protein